MDNAPRSPDPTPAQPIRALLFDKDGTLFDFAATWAVVTDAVLAALAPDPGTGRAMARALGYDQEARRFVPGSAIVAGTVEDCAAILAGFLPGQSEARIAATIERVTKDAVSGGALVPVLPDMLAFLDRLRAGGYRLGVATNDSEAAARQQIATAGFLDAFDFIAGADSGFGAKPGPGMLHAFAKAGGIAAAEVAVIGDSLHDMAMAGEAGLRIGVLTGPARREELAHAADIVIDSIAGLPELLAGADTSWRKGDRR